MIKFIFESVIDLDWLQNYHYAHTRKGLRKNSALLMLKLNLLSRTV